MKFLIVDDSKAMQTIVHKALVTSGYSDHDYDFAYNGIEALDKIHDSKPDIVLTDWHMPEMSGLELLEKIRDESLNIKVGFVTTERFKDRVQAAKDAGALFVVSKPFTAETLHTAVEEALADNYSSDEEKTDGAVTLPSLPQLTSLVTTICARDITIEENDSYQLNFDLLPYIVCLYENNDQTVAVAILDAAAACYIGFASAKADQNEATLAIQNHLVPKETFDKCKLLMELLSSHIQNPTKNTTTKVKGIHMVNKQMDKFRSLVDSHRNKGHIYKVNVPDYGSGAMLLLKY